MTTTNSPLDFREQLYNDRRTGLIHEVQLPLERVTTLHGVMIDLDPKLYRAGNPFFPPAADPRAFYQGIKPVLDRHPLARHAEVRMSGTGLHVLIWFGPAVELHSESDQRRWDHIVGLVQCSLPADPGAPRITALTRAVGSLNSKNGATVEVLKPGEPVTPKEVEAFVARVLDAPFREIASVLLGHDRISPCPVCAGNGSRLDVLDHEGKCYGGCDRVGPDALLDCVYAPMEPSTEPAVPPAANGSMAGGKDSLPGES
jgi:hypothetical protein